MERLGCKLLGRSLISFLLFDQMWKVLRTSMVVHGSLISCFGVLSNSLCIFTPGCAAREIEMQECRLYGRFLARRSQCLLHPLSFDNDGGFSVSV